MDRRSNRYGYLAALAVLATAVLAAGGCQALIALTYVIKGTDEPADFDGLKNKKVAVVCRPLVNLDYKNPGAARELAERITDLLQTKIPKCHVIEQQKVAAWMDENTFEDPLEAGRGLKADIVVSVDLTSFGIQDGATLYRGRASAVLKVYDVAEKKVVFSRPTIESLYPPGASIPVSDMGGEGHFRAKFIQVLAEKIARHFYDHDPYGDVAQDAAAGGFN